MDDSNGWGPPANSPKPKGRWNWQTGKVEPIEADPDDEHYDHVMGVTRPQPAVGGGSAGGIPPGPRSIPGGRPNFHQPPVSGWKQKTTHLLERATDAGMRQAIFRSRHGAQQGIRYTLGLPPMGRQTRRMYQAEGVEDYVGSFNHGGGGAGAGSLSPRQFPVPVVTPAEEDDF